MAIIHLKIYRVIVLKRFDVYIVSSCQAHDGNYMSGYIYTLEYNYIIIYF